MTATPRPIEPQDIRPGDRICIAWSVHGIDRTMTLTAAEVDLESMVVKSAGRDWVTIDPAGAVITLLDRPVPPRPVGSHWRDLETGVEYVRTDRLDEDTTHYVTVTHRGETPNLCLHPANRRHAEIIARLTPLPVFDPATLWPAADSVLHCLALYTAEVGWACSRPAGHDGLHAAYAGHAPGAENLRYVWGRP